ncbi:methyltransferase type 11 [Candidatus Methylomirabilis lanthanidiphila]|uniref:Methyltransferase type 11 n=1 Tax=Candidatus Methylomirabilis lanthanidiphila TaxID=2211376 RepID=A0A564ZG74_9BACT|nr:methyltransferase domain-containing protein [Candidatus Methylomirabilis lanthanidiphila]VUZ84330.1 methyltransferase type 11 [Candidatus Methylomirabilis lanthanidiphila]
MVALDYKQITRAYAILSPMYDLLFERVFHPGRVAAVQLLDVKPNDIVLEVGIGTGLNLPLYPQDCHLVGIDLSRPMLSKAEEKVRDYGMTNVTIKEMDASKLEFPDAHFDHVLATYVISAVPEPVQVLQEIKRVCKKKGHIVILNHFKSENPVVGTMEELIAPLCTRLGFKTDLRLMPVLKAAQLIPEQLHRVNMLNGWRLVRCLNE